MREPARVLRNVLLAVCTAAVLAPAARADDALDARLRRLESGLRCLVCQNQTLAESDADLAADLRREVRQLAVAGRSDDEIRRYLVARYGDFVLYDPPLKPVTWLLWFGPFVLLGAGVAVWLALGRNRRRASAEATSGEAASAEAVSAFEAQARNLLAAGKPVAIATASGDAAREPLDS